MGSQVALMEQHEECLVVGSARGICEYEAFEFLFAGEPIGGPVAE
jgi:hypothetical protein